MAADQAPQILQNPRPTEDRSPSTRPPNPTAVWRTYCRPWLSPDFFCEHTGEVHFYTLNARQMAAFVRTGNDPKDGKLPPSLTAKLVPVEY